MTLGINTKEIVASKNVEESPLNCYLNRVSTDFAGPAKTNLLLLLCVRNGLIILLTARYHHGTLMKT